MKFSLPFTEYSLNIKNATLYTVFYLLNGSRATDRYILIFNMCLVYELESWRESYFLSSKLGKKKHQKLTNLWELIRKPYLACSFPPMETTSSAPRLFSPPKLLCLTDSQDGLSYYM